MSAPSVSIIVPAYNAQAYIGEALDSAIRQSFTDLEIVCVNDGSTDNTSRILDEYAKRDNRIRVITKNNSGYGDSVNIGFDEARGQFVTILEADDYLARCACQTFYDMVNVDSLDFAKADGKQFFGDGKDRMFRGHRIAENELPYEQVFNPSLDPRSFHCVPGQPAFYRKQFLDKNNIRLNTTPGASFQDTGLWAQAMFFAQRVRFTHKPLYMIRRDNEDSSVFDSRKLFAICDEYDYVRRCAERVPKTTRHRAILASAYFRFDGYLWNLRRIPASSHPAFLDKFSQDFTGICNSGELERSYFSDNQWDLLQSIIEKGTGFVDEWYCLRITELEIAVSNKEQRYLSYRREVQQSPSWKIGRAFTKIPRMVRSYRHNVK